MARAMWFAQDSVTSREPDQLTVRNEPHQQSSEEQPLAPASLPRGISCLELEEDAVAERVATTLDNIREVPLQHTRSSTAQPNNSQDSLPEHVHPPTTPDRGDATNMPHQDDRLTVPLMLHKCQARYLNGNETGFGKVLEIEADDISLASSNTFKDFQEIAQAKMIRRFGHEVGVHALTDLACLSQIRLEYGKSSSTIVTAESWNEVQSTIRLELESQRKVVINLWFTSFGEAQVKVKKKKKWWPKLEVCFGRSSKP